jgi:putative hydrolase of the HAD superfamily
MERNVRETLADMYIKFHLQERGIADANLFVDHYNCYNDKLWDRYRKKIIDKGTLRALRFRQTFAHFGIHDKQLAYDFESFYLKQAPLRNYLISGAIDILDYLKLNYEIHIITNGFTDVQMKKIQNSGLSPYLKTIITSEECGYTKPDYHIFAHASKVTGGKLENTLMIGDDLQTDIIGAKNFGWHQVYFNSTKTPHNEEVTYEIQSLNQLKQFL